MRTLAVEVRHFLAGELEYRPFAFLEWDIDMGEADALEEGDDTGDGPDFSDLDIVTRCSCPCGDEQLFIAFVTDSPQNPEPVPIRTLFVRARLTDNFDAIAAGDQIAESGFGDHIWCFFF